jgi:hypothetical protein
MALPLSRRFAIALAVSRVMATAWVGGSIPMSERGSISVSAKVHLTDWRGLIIVKP